MFGLTGPRCTSSCATTRTVCGKQILIASALLGNPRVLLLDEPIECLDAQSTALLRTLLRELCKRVLVATPAERAGRHPGAFPPDSRAQDRTVRLAAMHPARLDRLDEGASGEKAAMWQSSPGSKRRSRNRDGSCIGFPFFWPAVGRNICDLLPDCGPTSLPVHFAAGCGVASWSMEKEVPLGCRYERRGLARQRNGSTEMDKLRISLAMFATVFAVGALALPAHDYTSTSPHAALSRESDSWGLEQIIRALEAGALSKAVPVPGDPEEALRSAQPAPASRLSPSADQEMAGFLEWLMQLLPIHPDCISLSADAPPCVDGQPVNFASISGSAERAVYGLGSAAAPST